MTTVTITFVRGSRFSDIDDVPLSKYILPTNDTEPYYFWWSEIEFSYIPNREVGGIRLKEVEENGTVQTAEVSGV